MESNEEYSVDIKSVQEGDEIDLDLHRVVISTYCEQSRIAQELMSEGAHRLAQARENIFKEIRALHPELDPFHFTVDHKRGILVVLRRRVDEDGLNPEPES